MVRHILYLFGSTDVHAAFEHSGSLWYVYDKVPRVQDISVKSSHTCPISQSLHLLIIVEQTGNIFHFVLLQSESKNTFLIAQLAV